MTRSSPEAMRPIARLCAQWPMMRSTHPRNCDPDSLLEQIELAKGVSVQMDKYSKWKPGFASTYAVRLYEHLHGVRNDNPRIHSPNRKAAHLKDLLPEFNKDNSNQWWQWAEAFFLATYPEPQNIPELAALVADPKKRRTPGRLKQAIKDKIKAAFLALPLPELKPLNG